MFSPYGSLMLSLAGEAHFARLQRYWQLGTPEQTPERWRMLSPTYSIDRIRAPSLMQLPEQEYRYGLDYLVPLIREHRADVYVFPNEPHQKFQPRHKLAVYERNLDWFRFWLQGIEDGDHRKRAQYERWRVMREISCAKAQELRRPWYCPSASRTRPSPSDRASGDAVDAQGA